MKHSICKLCKTPLVVPFNASILEENVQELQFFTKNDGTLKEKQKKSKTSKKNKIFQTSALVASFVPDATSETASTGVAVHKRSYTSYFCMNCNETSWKFLKRSRRPV